jgi:hypothetical protein
VLQCCTLCLISFLDSFDWGVLHFLWILWCRSINYIFSEHKMQNCCVAVATRQTSSLGILIQYKHDQGLVLCLFNEISREVVVVLLHLKNTFMPFDACLIRYKYCQTSNLLFSISLSLVVNKDTLQK